MSNQTALFSLSGRRALIPGFSQGIGHTLAQGYFETPLNAALIADPEFTARFEKRTPAGRWGKVEKLIGACVFLASDASSFINGHTLNVDGGITISL